MEEDEEREKIIVSDVVLHLYFGGIMGHVKIEEVPLPFKHSIVIDEFDSDIVQRELIKICVWNRENLSSSTWYINPKEFYLGDYDVEAEFNFSTDADLMAFKLRWS